MSLLYIFILTFTVYNGRPLKYHANAKNSQDRFIYESVVSMLQEKKPVQSIAKHVGIAKSTVYEIKKRNNFL